MYVCDTCNYITERGDNYERHIKSRKHICNVKKIKYYKCNECEYETQYKHCLLRHKKLKQDNIDKLLVCELCNYKTLKQTLFQKHTESELHQENVNKTSKQSSETEPDKTVVENSNDTTKMLTILMQTMSTQNQELIKQILSENKELLIELINTNKTITTNSHNTNTNKNSHNTYNVVQILDYYNTNMKDAMTIEKFNELIRPIQTGEFLKIGDTKKSYKKILSENYQTKLNDIPQKKRPLACYDTPNMCFIVNKDGEGWILDHSNNEIKKSIYTTHKGVLECASNTMNDDEIMKRYESKVMNVLIKANVPKDDIENITHEIIKVISNKPDYKSLTDE